jgi:type I restriction enzyme S subunit
VSAVATSRRDLQVLPTLPLSELAEFRRGLTYKKTDEVEQSDNAVLRANNIDLDTGRVNLSDIRYIDPRISVPHGKRLAPESVLICTASGSKAHLGKAAYIADLRDFAFGGFMGLLVPYRSLSAKYLWYFMRSTMYLDFIGSLSGGTNINNLNFRDLGQLRVPAPPREEQKRVVAVLDQAFAALDRARAHTARSERQANEIFDCVLASVAGEQIPLGGLVTLRTGKLDANAAVEDGQYPFFTCAKDVYAIDRFAFDCEAILLAGNNAVGDFNVKHYQGKFNAYQRTYVITVNDTNRLLYRYLYFQLVKSLKHFKEQSVGAGTKFLKLGMINGLGISVPPIAQQQRVVAELDALLEKTQRLQVHYTRKLADIAVLRQSLLQKAFAGELT